MAGKYRIGSLKTKNILFNSNLIVLSAFVLLSYPLFYFSYKFCLPDFGGQDFYSYYSLYKDWDFERMVCPHNMRVISAFCIFLMNKIGFYYDTEIVFTTFYPQFDQQVFFNAIFFNYICVVLTCMLLYRLVLQHSENKLYSFLAGCTYLLGFGTLFFSLKPLTESCGVLLLAITFYYYIKRSYWIFILLPIALFQREYIFIVFGIISLVDFYFNRMKYCLGILVISVLLFSVFIVLRKTLFHTPHFEYQMSVHSILYALMYLSAIDWASFIKQSILLSNLLFLYFFVVIYKQVHHFSVNNNYLVNIIFLLVQVLIMGIMIQGAENVGRIFYYTTPILIFYLFVELKPLLSSYIHLEKQCLKDT